VTSLHAPVPPGFLIRQREPRAPLEQLGEDTCPVPPAPPARDDEVCLEILACAFAPYDLDPPQGGAWPRIPGGAIAGRAPGGELLACSGFLPCRACRACRFGHTLACSAPIRPGWNHSGGLASSATLPRASLVPLPPMDPALLARAIALVGGAGAVYQAAAEAGLCPGDTAVVLGPAGSTPLPCWLLGSLGMRVHALPARAEGGRCELPELESLPASRIHLLDLHPCPASLAAYAPAARAFTSITLVGPRGAGPGLTASLHDLLGGTAPVRWVSDLHPHLLLELVAHAANRGESLDPLLETVGPSSAAPAFQARLDGRSDRTQVLRAG
jgi:hypothetical protein